MLNLFEDEKRPAVVAVRATNCTTWSLRPTTTKLARRLHSLPFPATPVAPPSPVGAVAAASIRWEFHQQKSPKFLLLKVMMKLVVVRLLVAGFGIGGMRTTMDVVGGIVFVDDYYHDDVDIDDPSFVKKDSICCYLHAFLIFAK